MHIRFSIFSCDYRRMDQKPERVATDCNPMHCDLHIHHVSFPEFIKLLSSHLFLTFVDNRRMDQQLKRVATEQATTVSCILWSDARHRDIDASMATTV